MQFQRLTVGRGLLAASQLFYSIGSFVAGKRRLTFMRALGARPWLV